MSEPIFTVKPGQKDFTNEKRAPIVNCVVQCGGRILVARRSSRMNFYPGFWSGVSGFLDDGKDPQEKAKEELQEELGIGERNIIQIEEGIPFEQEDLKYGKVWVVHPVLVKVSADTVVPNWEIEDYKWVDAEEVETFELAPGFERVVAAVLKD
ncbi:hypothetical protein A2841_04160 [Candidatus Kaiserbacteria bacterium RIFCSPHIGHO2_01_FULL_48_10]|uniref:Nudix hydrolase domain-containing protein n=1 Tax=Candidatus Kaiserbacteria bacterium RIFCSPHIGHO2_01_FULL_48_10 TaxID=1798476 RepID=A0A1F6C4W1_9BACT|nr:MAG: hypothetical protein A2841_04160 [Candidatus Kaiserbacteria bacterium RIFCSPHIGHO2_01_FULL_48_10]